MEDSPDSQFLEPASFIHKIALEKFFGAMKRVLKRLILESVCDEQKAGHLVDGRAKRYRGSMESQEAGLGVNGTKSFGNTGLSQ